MIRSLLLVFVVLSLHQTAQAQYRRELAKEMNRLDADVSLVVRRSLDYLPIWSENSDTVYVNILDKWYAWAVRASLVETEIRGVRGGWNQVELLEPVSQNTIDGFELDGYMKQVKGDTLDKIEATIEYEGFISTLIIKINGKEYYRQKSGGEEYMFPRISIAKRNCSFPFSRFASSYMNNRPLQI
ncbi:MAG: hypothetical protein DCO96_14495 [Fluviicola sp. XM-24bin1]|nr:MAG: hypothetical protein DCO96_14495 [Fluviicola sp. XM-24bin1]